MFHADAVQFNRASVSSLSSKLFLLHSSADRQLLRRNVVLNPPKVIVGAGTEGCVNGGKCRG